jgi:hypothetical protein
MLQCGDRDGRIKKMTDAGKTDKLKIAGIYLIVILALLRFLVYPLYSAVEKEKRVFDAQRESNLLKVRLLISSKTEKELQ